MPRRERAPGNRAAFSRIWSVVSRIPRGRVATYGQVARIAGFGSGARTAGWALRALPDDLRIDGRPVPWHRVITSSGKSAFDPNSRHFRIQRDRLAEEGVPLINGKVDMKKYRWEPQLDELLWKPSSMWDEE